MKAKGRKAGRWVRVDRMKYLVAYWHGGPGCRRTRYSSGINRYEVWCPSRRPGKRS